ncbi:InlB B-repeat-containing protein, partial [Anaerotignum sp.]
MRKRRFLAWLMTMVMAIGLMPATALADDSFDAAPAPVTSVSTESDNPIQITKSVNEDGNAITMEAYVTNEVTMQDKSKPMDIVLVLDVSGSMANNITSYQYVATQSQGWSYNNINKGDYYYKDGENYYKVSAESKRDWFSQTYWLEANGQQLGGTSTSKSATLYTGVLYTRQTASSVTKIAALQSAVNNFIDSVAKDAAANNVEHRISIVKFAGTKNNVVGDDKYDSGQYKYNYSQIVKTLTEVSGDGAGNLKTAVNKLTAAGATSADYGLELANTVLTNSLQENGKAVVMFTDGEPNHGNGFDGSVAATAVNTAKNLKDSGAKVFTVGVFDQTYSDESNVGKYMNAVSSNYPSATANGGWNNLSMGTRAEGNFYYTASNAGELDDVFQSISEEISNLTVTADANAVLTDTLSDKFEFGAAVGTDGSGVTVKKVPVTGKENGVYTWGSPVDVAGVTVTVDKKTGKIEVKGFDYTSKENAVTAKTENGVTTYSGYKLVLTFPIAPKADADWEKGTHYYDTNATAGLTNIEKDNEAASELLTDSPQVSVTAYGVDYNANGGQNPPTDAKGYLSGTEATVLPAGGMTKAGYRFTGWNTQVHGDGTPYADGDEITMTSDVTLYAQWTANTHKITVQYLIEGTETKLQDDAVQSVKYDDTYDATETTNVPSLNYGGDNYTKVSVVGTLTGTVKGDVVVKVYYSLDNWNDEEDKTTGGDGIPDKYQAKVTYEVENGTWDGEDAADKVHIFTVLTKDADGNLNATNVKLGDTIPNTEKAVPDEGYTTPAWWSPTPRATDAVKVGEYVYTYKFTTNEELTFTFDANGGAWEEAVSGYTMNADNTTASVDVDFGGTVTEIGTAPVREGYEFVGWYTKNQAGELTGRLWSDKDADEYPVYASETVYAKWQEVPEVPVTPDKKATLIVSAQDENGAYLEIDGLTTAPISVTKSYDITKDVPENVTAYGSNYIYEDIIKGSLSGNVTKDGEIILVILQYTKDNWDDENNETTGGDGIPDKYQAKVTYE